MQHFFNLDLQYTGVGMRNLGDPELQPYEPPTEAIELAARDLLPQTRERVRQVQRLFS